MAGNLIDNASKWAKRSVQVVATRNNAKLQVVVDDDGPGLPPEDRARVFERGERLDESVPGTGLGLALSQRIVHALGGELGCHSAPGEGSTFWIELPFAKPSMCSFASSTASASTKRTAVSGRRVCENSARYGSENRRCRVTSAGSSASPQRRARTPS